MQQEKKFDLNQIIGFALIGALLIGFMYFNQPTKEELAKQQEKELALKAQEANKKQTPAQDIVVVDSTLTTNNNLPSKDVDLENDKLKIKISGRGGYISELQMKEYSAFDSAASDHKKPLYLIQDFNNKFGITFKDNTGREINTQNLNFSPQIQKGDSTTIVTLTANIGSGNLQYIYNLKNGYTLDFKILSKGLSQITNEKNIKVNWNLDAISIEKGKQQETYWSQTYFRFKNTNDVEYDLLGKDEWTEEKPIDWIAFKQQFFSTVLYFDEGFNKPNGGSLAPEEDEHQYSKKYFFDGEIPIASNELNYNLEWNFVPLDYDLLKTYDKKDFDEIVPFGWGILGWMNKHFFLNIFKWLAKLGLEYGWVIFLMTIVVKLVLSPVMYKQYRQSAMMRILRPEINEINEKFKGKDAVKKQKATMDLYGKAGVNPLSGCLPALLQIPIFYALFRFFPNVINLRGESFLWAEDLTAFDSGIALPSWVPFMDSHLSIFALLYVIAMVVYFKVSGSMDNFQAPQQEGMPDMSIMKYMMYVMPLFFFVFLNNYASGLSWYYLVSNVINIGIVLFIKNVLIDDEKIHAKIQANKAKPKKQSKFSRKMSEMMEKAQEQQAQQKKKK